MHGYDQSIKLTLPPLSVMYFVCVEGKDQNEKINVAEEDKETMEELIELNEKIAEIEETENSDSDADSLPKVREKVKETKPTSQPSAVLKVKPRKLKKPQSLKSLCRLFL